MSDAAVGETLVAERDAVHVSGLRRDEVSQIAELLLSGERLVSVVGLGGIGKSSLAASTLDEVQRRRPEITRITAAASEDGADALLDQVLDALEAEPESDPRIVVVDGGEHLTGGAAALRTLLDEDPSIRLLVTSRVELGIPGERVFRLGGLDTGPYSDAVKLLLALADLEWEALAPADRASAHEVVTRLGGYPLAISLCAMRLREQPLEELRQQLIRHRDNAGATNPLINEVISWSIERQPRQAIQLLKTLATYSDWGTLDSIEGVATVAWYPDRTEVATQTFWMAQLVDAGLVEVQSTLGERGLAGGVTRYRVHESIRDAARTFQIGDEPSCASLVEAHRSWFVQRAGELAASVATRREAESYELLDAEVAEYLHAFAGTVDRDPMGVLRTVNRLGDFWLTRGRLRAGARLLRFALRVLGEDDEGLGSGPDESRLAQSLLHYMKLREGARIDEQAYDAWLGELLEPFVTRTAPPSRMACSLAVHRIFLSMVSRSYEQGLSFGTRCRDLATELGDDYHAGLFSFYLSRVAEQAGDNAAAIEHIERAAAHATRTQNDPFLARCLSQAVLLREDRRSAEDRVADLSPLRELLLRNRNFREAVLISSPLALACFEAGDPVGALELLRATLALAQRIHSYHGELYASVIIAFADLSEESTPENVVRCARLYGGLRPHLKHFFATTAPEFQVRLKEAVHALESALGRGPLEQIIAASTTSWPLLLAEIDAFAADLLASMPDAESGAETGFSAMRFAETVEQLNPREREVLELVLTGSSDKRIAQQLSLKPNTVRTYNSRLFRRFEVGSRAELIALHRDHQRVV